MASPTTLNYASKRVDSEPDQGPHCEEDDKYYQMYNQCYNNPIINKNLDNVLTEEGGNMF